MEHDEAAIRVAGFLIFNQDEDFCDRCLAVGTRLTPPQATVAVQRVAHFKIFLRDRWRCDACGAPGPVTRALPNHVFARGPRRLRATGAWLSRPSRPPGGPSGT